MLKVEHLLLVVVNELSSNQIGSRQPPAILEYYFHPLLLS